MSVTTLSSNVLRETFVFLLRLWQPRFPYCLQTYFYSFYLLRPQIAEVRKFLVGSITAILGWTYVASYGNFHWDFPRSFCRQSSCGAVSTEILKVHGYFQAEFSGLKTGGVDLELLCCSAGKWFLLGIFTFNQPNANFVPSQSLTDRVRYGRLSDLYGRLGNNWKQRVHEQYLACLVFPEALGDVISSLKMVLYMNRNAC
jgi:hypothetical protein